MIKFEIDEIEIRRLYLEKLDEKMKEIENELVFWDRKQLLRRTCMSWNAIQKEFFFDPRFPKYKVGSKWYFPATEAKQFLLQWLSEKAQR